MGAIFEWFGRILGERQLPNAASSVWDRTYSTGVSNEPGRILAGETASLAARLSSAFNNVLVTFYILWVMELSVPIITSMLICLANSGLAMQRIVEEGLPSFAFETRYDKVPLERLTSS